MSIETDKAVARGAITILQLQSQLLITQHQVVGYELREAQARLNALLADEAREQEKADELASALDALHENAE